MYVEFQLLGSFFESFARNVIQRIPICTDQVISFSGQELMIDRVTFTDDTRLDQESFSFPIRTDNGIQHVPGFRPIIRQEASIRLVGGRVRSNGIEPSRFSRRGVELIASVILFNDTASFLRLRLEGRTSKLHESLPDDSRRSPKLVRTFTHRPPIDTSPQHLVEDSLRCHQRGVAVHRRIPAPSRLGWISRVSGAAT